MERGFDITQMRVDRRPSPCAVARLKGLVDGPVLIEKRLGLRFADGRWWVLLDERIAGLGAQIRADLARD